MDALGGIEWMLLGAPYVPSKRVETGRIRFGRRAHEPVIELVVVGNLDFLGGCYGYGVYWDM